LVAIFSDLVQCTASYEAMALGRAKSKGFPMFLPLSATLA
jgi:hypothetical protein